MPADACGCLRMNEGIFNGIDTKIISGSWRGAGFLDFGARFFILSMISHDCPVV